MNVTKLLLAFGLLSSLGIGQQPLKVFILAGQSNMAGRGMVEGITTPGTLEYLVENHKETYGFLKNNNGEWVERNDVWIWCERTNKGLTSDFGTLQGPLKAGQGKTDADIGPELGFGHAVGDHYDGQVLLIKTAWGGTAVATEWRTPSQGVFPEPQDKGDAGFYYKLALKQIENVLDSLDILFPDYDKNEGYEVVGIGWHQGWNDAANEEIAGQYENNLAILIEDFRNDLGIVNLPFVIGLSGHGGYETKSGWVGRIQDYILPAQLNLGNPEVHPEFNGSVVTVETRDFWKEGSESPQTSSSHYNLNSETYWNIGKTMGTAMVEMLNNTSVLKKTEPPDISFSGGVLSIKTFGLHKVDIVTSSGKKVKSYFGRGNQFYTPFQKTAPGLYLVRIHSSMGTWIQKITNL